MSYISVNSIVEGYVVFLDPHCYLFHCLIKSARACFNKTSSSLLLCEEAMLIAGG